MPLDSINATIATVSVSATPMTSQIAVISDVEADIRWRDWRARGAASDRQTAAHMRNVMLFIIVALGVWFVVQLA